MRDHWHYRAIEIEIEKRASIARKVKMRGERVETEL